MHERIDLRAERCSKRSVAWQVWALYWAATAAGGSLGLNACCPCQREKVPSGSGIRIHVPGLRAWDSGIICWLSSSCGPTRLRILVNPIWHLRCLMSNRIPTSPKTMGYPSFRALTFFNWCWHRLPGLGPSWNLRLLPGMSHIKGG